MTDGTTDIRKLSDEVVSLKTDMAKLSIIAERLETTSEKLTEVSTTVSQLLAVQDQRLKNQERTAEKVQELMERRREEVDAAFGKVYNKTKHIEDDLHAEIELLRTEIKTSVHPVSDRVARLEKGGMVLTGGFLLLVWLLENSDKILPVVQP